MKSKISVIMTTYNGEKFILNQLDSIRLQSLCPDEVIICDDGSNDSTTHIVQKYIHEHNLKNWKLNINNKNLGWILNFYNGINLASGELVFFADQDDIWEKNKILTMSKIMEDDKINVLSCKCSYINSDNKKINVSSISLPFGKNKEKYLSKHKFDEKFVYSIYPGCTMCVKKNFWDYLINFTVSSESMLLPHDALVWKMGVLTNTAFELNDELIRYRLHDNNASNPESNPSYRIKSKKRRILEINNTVLQLNSFQNLYKHLNEHDENIECEINNMIYFHKLRIEFIEGKITIYKILKNRRYYRHINMMFGDILSKVSKEE